MIIALKKHFYNKNSHTRIYYYLFGINSNFDLFFIVLYCYFNIQDFLLILFYLTNFILSILDIETIVFQK